MSVIYYVYNKCMYNGLSTHADLNIDKYVCFFITWLFIFAQPSGVCLLAETRGKSFGKPLEFAFVRKV